MNKHEFIFAQAVGTFERVLAVVKRTKKYPDFTTEIIQIPEKDKQNFISNEHYVLEVEGRTLFRGRTIMNKTQKLPVLSGTKSAVSEDLFFVRILVDKSYEDRLSSGTPFIKNVKSFLKDAERDIWSDEAFLKALDGIVALERINQR